MWLMGGKRAWEGAVDAPRRAFAHAVALVGLCCLTFAAPTRDAVAASVPPYGHCRASRHEKVIVRDRDIVVLRKRHAQSMGQAFSYHDRFVACLQRSGSRHQIGTGRTQGDNNSIRVDQPGQFTITGPFITYLRIFDEKYAGESAFAIRQYDARTGRSTELLKTTVTITGGYAGLLAQNGGYPVAVSSAGTIAWIVGGYQPCPTYGDCGRVDTLLITQTRSTQVLDSAPESPVKGGPYPSITNLAIRGTVLSWTHLGQPRSVTGL